MVLIDSPKPLFSNKIRVFYITCNILVLILVIIYHTYHFFFQNYFADFHLTKFKTNTLRNNYTSVNSVLPFNILLLNLTFSVKQVYHYDGIAYDYYSKNDLSQSKTGYQWRIWPLPHEISQVENPSLNERIETSPFVVSKLPFVDAIYVTTGSHLIDRHQNLKKIFHRQGISIESINWRMKWNYTTCNSNLSRAYFYKRLNLKDKPLVKQQQQRCAITLEHVDIWYEMAERKVPLGLILEDDAIFVPFFKEKFTRMIYAAVDNGALRINGTCATSTKNKIKDDEWIHQNPMIVIGTCFNFHGQHFQKQSQNAPPLLSTHKSNPSRCTHAYLLTRCSAEALVNQLQAQKNDFWASDWLQNKLFPLSPTLQSFWMDPPLAYQGSEVIDIDKLSTFKIPTYL